MKNQQGQILIIMSSGNIERLLNVLISFDIDRMRSWYIKNVSPTNASADGFCKWLVWGGYCAEAGDDSLGVWRWDKKD